MIDIANTTEFKLGKAQGAIDFCDFLRDKVSAIALQTAWNEYVELHINPVVQAELTSINEEIKKIKSL